MTTIKGHQWEWDLTLDVTEIAEMTGWSDSAKMQEAFERATRDRDFCVRLIAAGTDIDVETVRERTRKWTPRDLTALIDDFVGRSQPDPQ